MFQVESANKMIARINNLTPSTQGLWGKMNVSQMLAHCNVTYDMVYTDKYPKPNAVMRFMLKLFVKNTVVGDKPYKKNIRTAPEFVIADERNFEAEKTRLIEHIKKTQSLGASHFDNKESRSFGRMPEKEWNMMFAKHLDHHLSQFGV